MSIAYTTLGIIKSAAYLDIQDAVDDAGLASCIDAASRIIDNATSRRFYAETQTRYYTASATDELFTGDLLSVTTLATDSAGDRTYATTWSATDYDLWPYNAVTDGIPYRSIRVAPNGRYSFVTTYAKGVRLTGSFGYCDVGEEPATIQEAAAFAAMWLWKRHKAIFGVSGTPELGALMMFSKEMRTDPDFMRLIAPYIDPARLGPSGA